jgi:hypothetical protein
MLEEYLARAMQAERIREIEHERTVNEARRLLGTGGPGKFSWFRRGAQTRASRASSAARAAGQPVSSIE